MEKEFRKQNEMKYNTFKFFCERLSPYLRKDDTRFRVIVPMHERVAMSLHRLGSGNELQDV